MERLTERWCKGMVKIKGCSTAYPDKERKGAPASNAIVRLAAYEDAMPLERAQELAQAEKDGRLVILGPVPAAKEGAEKPSCFYNDMGQEFCLGFGRGREDDEPIDKCKECWYCEFSLVREEADAALKKREEENNEAER